MSRGHQECRHSRVARGKRVTHLERHQAAHAVPEQCIWTSLLGGDSICDRFGELIDSIRQRLADAVAVSRIFDAPYIDIGRQQITPAAKDTGGSSGIGQTVESQARAGSAATQTYK
jgi:hypothetical protein